MLVSRPNNEQKSHDTQRPLQDKFALTIKAVNHIFVLAGRWFAEAPFRHLLNVTSRQLI